MGACCRLAGSYAAIRRKSHIYDTSILTLEKGQVPYIRSPRSNAAEMIAKKLDTKIRDAILSSARSTSGSGLFAQDSSGLGALQRPGGFQMSVLCDDVNNHRLCFTYNP